MATAAAGTLGVGCAGIAAAAEDGEIDGIAGATSPPDCAITTGFGGSTIGRGASARGINRGGIGCTGSLSGRPLPEYLYHPA